MLNNANLEYCNENVAARTILGLLLDTQKGKRKRKETENINVNEKGIR